MELREDQGPGLDLGLQSQWNHLFENSVLAQQLGQEEGLETVRGMVRWWHHLWEQDHEVRREHLIEMN